MVFWLFGKQDKWNCAWATMRTLERIATGRQTPQKLLTLSVRKLITKHNCVPTGFAVQNATNCRGSDCTGVRHVDCSTSRSVAGEVVTRHGCIAFRFTNARECCNILDEILGCENLAKEKWLAVKLQR